MGLSPIAVTSTSDIVPVLSKEFLDTQTTIVWIHSEIHTWHDKNIQHLSCFAMVPRGIHRNVDTCQTDYNIHSKLEVSSYSEITHEFAVFKLTKC